MTDEDRKAKSLVDLNEYLRLSCQYNDYDTDALRALQLVYGWLRSYDSEGTATHAELLACEALGTLFDHIHNAELANRFLNQPKTRQGAIDELTKELKDEL
jgi:hypothetical protein